MIKINWLFHTIKLKYNIPSPPNFNIKPARIIEPETGASTWALGNHK